MNKNRELLQQLPIDFNNKHYRSTVTLLLKYSKNSLVFSDKDIEVIEISKRITIF